MVEIICGKCFKMMEPVKVSLLGVFYSIKGRTIYVQYMDRIKCNKCKHEIYTNLGQRVYDSFDIEETIQDVKHAKTEIVYFETINLPFTE